MTILDDLIEKTGSGTEAEQGEAHAALARLYCSGSDGIAQNIELALDHAIAAAKAGEGDGIDIAVSILSQVLVATENYDLKKEYANAIDNLCDLDNLRRLGLGKTAADAANAYADISVTADIIAQKSVKAFQSEPSLATPQNFGAVIEAAVQAAAYAGKSLAAHRTAIDIGASTEDVALWDSQRQSIEEKMPGHVRNLFSHAQSAQGLAAQQKTQKLFDLMLSKSHDCFAVVAGLPDFPASDGFKAFATEKLTELETHFPALAAKESPLHPGQAPSPRSKPDEPKPI